MSHSGFPADATFEQDARPRIGHIKIWRHAKYRFDFTQVRDGPRWHISGMTGVNEPDTTSAIDDLVTWGYLIEHPRGERNMRRFTLAWSVHPDLVHVPTVT